MALSKIGDLALFKKRNQGVEELEGLLDLLPHATLLVEGRSGRVLLGNAQATQLSAYTRQELSELQLGTLLPGFAIRKLSHAAEDLPVELVKRNSSTMAVRLAVSPLNGGEGWSALSIQPAASIEQQRVQQKLQKERWEALHMLNLAAQQKELASTYRRILQAGNLLTGAAHLALYVEGEAGQLSLESVYGSGLDWPTRLAERDLGHLRTPKLWQAGKAVEAPLHQLAHANKLVYLASSPLDLTQPSRGLLVAADAAAGPPAEILTLAQILAASAMTAGMYREMNRHLEAEFARLAEQAQLNERLQENVQDGLIFFDNQLQLTDINPAAESMLGYTAREAQGRHANEILISTRSLLSTLEDVAQHNKLVDVGEIHLHHRDGSDFLAHVRVASIAKGEAVSQLAVLITDLSEHEDFHIRSQQLRQRAELGEVIARVAHEMRNPINNMSTGLQLLQTDFADDDPIQEQLAKLMEDCDRLEHRLKGLQNFSRTLDYSPERMDIGEFCRQQLERWKPRMGRNNIDSHIQVAKDTPDIMGDRRALDQVFTNLITNSLQAMDDQDGGVIAIKIKPISEDGKDWVEINLSDTGPGIPPDLREVVFDAFFTTKKEEGTGLGLAITRSLIMTHKGDISLQSFPGGTLFRIKLPAAPPDPDKDPDPA